MRWLWTKDKGLRHLPPLLLLLALPPTSAFSQDYQRWVTESSNSRMIREVREAFVKEHMETSLAALDADKADPVKADRDFISRVPRFRTAVAKYRTAMIGEASPSKSLKEISHLVD